MTLGTNAFEATVRDGAEPGEAVVDLQGEIDGRAQGALEGAYADAARRDPRRVRLNFAGVDYINSTGIALIVGLLARARAESRQVAASGLSDHYREIFEITRLVDFMTILPDDAPPTSADRPPTITREEGPP
jgi:anti-anti-sigma factor